MNDRASRIEHHRNYCVHYKPEPKATVCAAGMDIKAIQCVATTKGIKWGPCIGGHTLDNPLAACPKWERRSLESAEKYADDVDQSIARMLKIGPAIRQWREKQPIGKAEVIECPVCKGRLHLRQSSYNGHVHGHCETPDCVSWME